MTCLSRVSIRHCHTDYCGALAFSVSRQMGTSADLSYAFVRLLIFVIFVLFLTSVYGLTPQRIFILANTVLYYVVEKTLTHGQQKACYITYLHLKMAYKGYYTLGLPVTLDKYKD